MEPYSVAPTRKAGNEYLMPAHIRYADHISYQGKPEISPVHRAWKPPEKLPGLTFARKVKSDYTGAKVVYWPGGQNPEPAARKVLEGRVIRNVSPETTIDTLVRNAA